jgi:WD40 repeat protein
MLEIQSNSLIGHDLRVQCALQLADRTIMTGSWDDKLKVWDEQALCCTRTLAGHRGTVTCIIQLFDGKVASGSFDRTINIWDPQQAFACTTTLSGHRDGVTSIAQLPDGRIVSGSVDGALIVWDLYTPSDFKVLLVHMNAVERVFWSEQCRSILSTDRDFNIIIWNPVSFAFKKLVGHSDLVSCLISLNERHLLSASYDCILMIWDTVIASCSKSVVAHEMRISCIVLLADRRIVSGSYDGHIKIWDKTLDICELVLNKNASPVLYVEQLKDGSDRLLSGSSDPISTFNLWNINSGECLASLGKCVDGIISALLLQDGRVLSWNNGKTLTVWTMTTVQHVPATKTTPASPFPAFADIKLSPNLVTDQAPKTSIIFNESSTSRCFPLDLYSSSDSVELNPTTSELPLTEISLPLTGISPTGNCQPEQVIASSPWNEHKSPDGVSYWYNVSTGVSTWENPEQQLLVHHSSQDDIPFSDMNSKPLLQPKELIQHDNILSDVAIQRLSPTVVPHSVLSNASALSTTMASMNTTDKLKLLDVAETEYSSDELAINTSASFDPISASGKRVAGRTLSFAKGVPPNVAINSWGIVDHRRFSLRKIGYNKSKQKAPSSPPLYDIFAVDAFCLSKRIDNISSHIELPDTSDLISQNPHVPPIFIVQVQMPSKPPPMFSTVEDGPGWALVLYFKMTKETCRQLQDISTASSGVKLFAKWCEKAPSDPAWKARFKVIASCLNMSEMGMPSIVTSYNAKPVLIRKTSSVFKTTEYIETCIHVFKFANLAKQSIHMVTSRCHSMYMECGFTIEGVDDKELPEVLIGCAAINRPQEKDLRSLFDK